MIMRRCSLDSIQPGWKWWLSLRFHLHQREADAVLSSHDKHVKKMMKSVFLLQQTAAVLQLQTFFFFFFKLSQWVAIKDKEIRETKWIQKLYNNQRVVDGCGDWAISPAPPLPLTAGPLFPPLTVGENTDLSRRPRTGALMAVIHSH